MRGQQQFGIAAPHIAQGRKGVPKDPLTRTCRRTAILGSIALRATSSLKLVSSVSTFTRGIISSALHAWSHICGSERCTDIFKLNARHIILSKKSRKIDLVKAGFESVRMRTGFGLEVHAYACRRGGLLPFGWKAKARRARVTGQPTPTRLKLLLNATIKLMPLALAGFFLISSFK